MTICTGKTGNFEVFFVSVILNFKDVKARVYEGLAQFFYLLKSRLFPLHSTK